MMEKAKTVLVEEGGITVYADIETNVLKLIKQNPMITCPDCRTIMSMNGKCSTCPECGWSSCSI